MASPGDVKHELYVCCCYKNTWLSPQIWAGSFAQWQYRSQWGSSEARLLLIENYTQYPALVAWNTAAGAIFEDFSGSRCWNQCPNWNKPEGIVSDLSIVF